MHLTRDNFHMLANEALRLEPSAERLVLSNEQIAKHNKELDEYMVKNYPDAWVKDPGISEYVFAATGKIFVRLVAGMHEPMSKEAEWDGAVYMLADVETGEAMGDDACDVIEACRLQ